MNKNYIIVSSLDWDANWQIPHELTKTLVKNKDRVLYIENTGVRSVMFSDWQRVYHRIVNFLKSAKGFKRENDEFSIFSPILFPFPYSKTILPLNKYFYIRDIKKWIEINKFNQTILVCFLPTPLNLELIKNIKFKKIIYYCLDNLSSGYNDSNKISQYEKIFIKKSNLSFFTSRKLKEKNFIKNKSLLLPAGVNLNDFKKKRIFKRSKSKKIIGYIGAVSNVFDQDLVIGIAKIFKNYEIHIIGPIFVDISKLLNVENIKFFNQIKHNKLQDQMVNFDLGIIPYYINKYTDCVYPCKLNEYLALGLPVVSTNIFELRNKVVKDPNIFSIGKNKQDFCEKILFELKNDNNKKIKNRILYAKKNSWEQRFKYFNSSINAIINKDNEITNKWIDIFIEQANVFKKKFYQTVFAATFLYLLIFNSSLVWQAGNYLRYFDQPQKSQALVLFSGDGQDSYINNSYQQRALDAIYYYKEGFFKNIYISSGREQTIPETQLIEAFIINSGIPKDLIFIQKKYPDTTKKNIENVYQELKKKKINKILFLTSPFHSRRAHLIWKNYNDIEVISVKPINDNYHKKKFNMKFKDIKIIGYEYLSILYNLFRGNIS